MERWSELWPYAVSAAVLTVALVTAGHAVLHKRDSRAALLWVGLIWLAPLVGSVLYVLLGINRIRRRARVLRADLQRVSALPAVEPITSEELGRRFPDLPQLAAIQRVVNRVEERPLLPGNSIEPLDNGDQAYPAMLAAIDSARRSVSLATYIFKADAVGRAFVERLARAVERGVEVRVLVDDAGAHYGFPSIRGALRRAGIRHAFFHPRLRLLPGATLNLRNHKKICVIDGAVGFTGGMNIQSAHVLAQETRRAVRDIHFRITGPVVAQLQESFASDWIFATDERLEGGAWFPPLEPTGTTLGRAIDDGPDEELGRLRWVLLGAIDAAQRSIRVVTPYFLPDPALISALSVAALRGAEVDVVIPARNNIRLVQWATHSLLWQLLRHGCRVWETTGPFDHAKLMVVDDAWSLIGSANWDQRSLRLNFELVVEGYDPAFARTVAERVQARIEQARPVTWESVEARRLPVRLRDGVARLFTPLL